MAWKLAGTRLTCLGPATTAKAIEESCSALVEWRCFLLSHHILANLQLLNQRLGSLDARDQPQASPATTSLEAGEPKRDPSPSKGKLKASPSASPTPTGKGGKGRGAEEHKITESQLRRDFLSFILRHLVETLGRLVEEFLALKVNCPLRLVLGLMGSYLGV